MGGNFVTAVSHVSSIKATQEGLEVYLENNTSESITVDITVLGKSILSSNAYVFDS